MNCKVIDGGVTSPKGYKATGGFAGIKSGIKDMSLLVSDTDANAAAAFTTNVVKAASVLRNMEVIAKGGKIRGIAVNSGNANACTGLEGEAANAKMAKTLADKIGVSEDMVLTASTGVIGAVFPIDKVEAGIEKLFPYLGSSREDGHLAAEGIMTTDTYAKEAAVEVQLGGKTVTLGGMAKGSGMICPNMATMLGFVTTDCAISREMLDKALKSTIDSTFNMVSVDGDTSTNDTIVVLANGEAGNPEITAEGADYEAFREALYFINEKLAKDLVRDGEGATKFIEANVTGVESEEKGKVLAKAIIKSNLVKAAMFGCDANWGRVLCAMGYSGADFDPKGVDVSFRSEKGSIELLKMGTPIIFDEDKALEILKERDIIIDVTLHEGSASAKAWGCDLSYEYVKINGEYRS